MPRCCECGGASTGRQTCYGSPCCDECFANRYVVCAECGITAYRHDGCGICDLCYNCYCLKAHWSASDMTEGTTTKKTGTNRLFGVELETSRCPNHTNLCGKTKFGAKEDGSIEGLEFVSPKLCGDKGLAEIRKFCRQAKKLGFKVDNECGFHLHIDMRDMTVTQRKSIAYAYRITNPVWKHLVAEHRWHNSYCAQPSYRSNTIRNNNNFEQFESRSRYEFVNLNAYRSHGTYEMRGYQGTLDSTEICNWIKAHLKFIEFVKDKSCDELHRMFNNANKCRRKIRKIFGTVLSNYYATQFRKHANRYSGVTV